MVDFEKQAAIEAEVTERIQRAFHFVVFEFPEKERRLELERKMIGTVSLCEDCGPSPGWLGLASPKRKIRASGLWQEQELWKESLVPEELSRIGHAGRVDTKERQDRSGRAYKGSQLQVQIYVNRRREELSSAVATALGEGISASEIQWRAPLEAQRFQEPMDAEFLEALGLGEYADQLRSFWPRSGPRWDGLAVVRQEPVNGVLLVEGKSYPDEMNSTMAAKSEPSIRQIRESLAWTKGVLGADRAADWTAPYYQYANRLAHMCFLRYELRIPAWLVNLCFTDDQRHVSTPEDKWRRALTDVKRALGFESATIPHTVDVLLPARPRSDLVVDAE